MMIKQFLKMRRKTLLVVRFLVSGVLIIAFIDLIIINRFKSNKPGYAKSLENIYDGVFTPPELVQSPTTEFLNLGFILINISNSSKFSPDFEERAVRELESLLPYSSGNPLHLIVMTNQKSVKAAAKMLGDTIAKWVSELVITKRWSRIKGIPIIRTSYVDLGEVVTKNQDFVQALKKHSDGMNDHKNKYANDLFYIAPLYHRTFPQLEKLLVIDCSDLMFLDDIKKVFDEFEHMENKLIGIGLDLSPHYKTFLDISYLPHHPDSNFGKPGSLQGFNTGVVLYNLEGMRNSNVYNSYLNPEEVNRLAEKYEYHFTLAEQDWMTNLGWERPEIFHILPCKFNMQVSIQYLTPPWEESFMNYHFCVPASQAIVIHRNGCGPSPKFCRTDVKKTGYSANHSMVHHLQLNIPQFWQMLATLDIESFQELLSIWVE